MGFLFLLPNFVLAATYYVSTTDGNDSNCTGLSTSTYISGVAQSCPFKTLTKLNTKTLSPGDNVLFKKGDTFYGSITITQSGTASNPITFSSYGSGAQPIISGFADITAWTNQGGNIWESTNAVSTLSNLNIVIVDGVNTPMGRTPNLDNVYLFQTHDANNSITSNNLNGTPNWTGAEVVIRKEGWVWQVSNVTSQAGGTVFYTDKQPGIYTPNTNNSGFFFQNDIRTLDAQNEWYYNPTTKKLSIYSIGQPSNVKVPILDSLVSMYNKDYIIFDDLHFTGANKWAVFINTADYVTVSNSTIDKIGWYGITTYADNYSSINGNIFNDCNHVAVNSGGGSSNNITITNNNISNTYMIQGIGGTVYPLGAIAISSNNALVRYNNIDYSGYNGIIISTQTATIKNNFINHSMQKLSDGGGIYTGGSRTNILIEENIILNSLGYPLGAPNNYVGAKGIYLDKGSSNVTVRNSLVAGGEVGLSMSSYNVNNIFDGNTSFNNIRNLDITNFFGEYGVTHSNVVTNNKFITKSRTGNVAKFQSSYANDIETFFSNINNNIYARPLNDTDTIFFYQPNITVPKNFQPLSYWQSFSGQDSNSKKSPVAVSSESDIFFDYNATQSSKTASLLWAAVDISGNKQAAGNIVIPPYGSAIYLKDPNPTVATPPDTGSSTPSIVPPVTTSTPPVAVTPPSSGGGGGGGYVAPVITTATTSVSVATTSTPLLTSPSVDAATVIGSQENSNQNQKPIAQSTIEAKKFVEVEKKAVNTVSAAMSTSLSGRLLLQAESHGEAWYVNPKNKLKYYLGTPEMAFSIMRTLGQGISNANLEKIKIADANLNTNLDSDSDGLSDSLEDAIGSNKNSSDTDGDGYDDKTELLNSYNTNGANKLNFDATFTSNQQGKIFLQVEGHGEAWYVNPVTNLRYYLGRPEDAYNLMRSLSLGISNSNLRKIGVGEVK